MYGRARRLQALKIAGYILGGIIVIYLAFMFFIHIFGKKNNDEEFSKLREYMKSKGFSCELLKENMSSCKYSGDDFSVRFVRRNDGFEYIIVREASSINIKHVKDQDEFIFSTTMDALKGYKSKKYYCSYNDSIIGTLKECVDEDNNKLDAAVYIGDIESAMNDLALILKSSGYDVNKLLKEYKWEQ